MLRAPGQLLAMIKITKAFDYAYEGIHVRRLEVDAEVADDDPAGRWALEHKCGKKAKRAPAQAETETETETETDSETKPDPDGARRAEPQQHS